MRNKKAFTLIEILLVIIILSVIVVLSAPNFSNSFKKMELKRTASDIVYLVRWAQARATKDITDYQLVFMDNFLSYRILRSSRSVKSNNEEFIPVKTQMGRLFNIPRSIKVECEEASFKIYPDGTLDKVRINLSNKESRLIISTVELRGNIFIIEDDNGA